MGDHFRLSLVLPHSILSLLCSKTLTVKIMRKMLGYMCMLNYMYVGKQSRHISMCACLWYGHKALRLTCKIHLTFLYLFVTEIKTLERLKYECFLFGHAGQNSANFRRILITLVYVFDIAAKCRRKSVILQEHGENLWTYLEFPANVLVQVWRVKFCKIHTVQIRLIFEWQPNI